MHTVHPYPSWYGTVMPATCREGQFRRKAGVMGTIVAIMIIMKRAIFLPLSLVRYIMIPPVIVPTPEKEEKQKKKKKTKNK